MKLIHKRTSVRGGKEQHTITWEYTDKPELNQRIDTAYKNTLAKYEYDLIIDSEIAKNKKDPHYGLEIVYDIEHNLYHHVKEQFMIQYGGLEKPVPTQTDILLKQIKDRQGVDDTGGWNNMYDARVELYTNIIGLFQEYGGIPKLTHN
jgi:hypothetical protein|tara:strand:- start:466 stop:909 length:444 start_codon:yes stop_codon:yes gene_type:complete